MPLTVITLKNVPQSLRGDLTKWMQEIATGVYVGNFNSRVREKLWKRVTSAVDCGEATMTYAYRNEIGYNFQTVNADRQLVDLDGIPFVFVPASPTSEKKLANGFSNAAKMNRARKYSSNKAGLTSKKGESNGRYVVLDVETTGLKYHEDRIIEVGAILDSKGSKTYFDRLVKIDSKLPETISKMTGITDEMLAENGQEIASVLADLVEFIKDNDIVGYYVSFDISFLNAELERCSMPPLENRSIDLRAAIKKSNIFQMDYKLETSLHSYGIDKKVPHRALEDAKLIDELYNKVNKIHDMKR